MTFQVDPMVLHNGPHCRVVGFASLLVTQWFSEGIALQDVDALEFHTRRLVERYGEVSSLVILGGIGDKRFQAMNGPRMRMFDGETRCQAYLFAGPDPVSDAESMQAMHDELGLRCVSSPFVTLGGACRWIASRRAQHPALRRPLDLIAALTPVLFPRHSVALVQERAA